MFSTAELVEKIYRRSDATIFGMSFKEAMDKLREVIKKENNPQEEQREIDRLQSLLDAEINANRDMSLREYELAKIVTRCGGWKTEDDHWVQGFDTVEYTGTGHRITVRNTAGNVPEGQRHLYSKTVLCDKCGSIMWTTQHCGTFCRECDARTRDYIPMSKKAIDDICKEEDKKIFNDPLIKAVCSCSSCGKPLNPSNDERIICNVCLENCKINRI